MSSQQKHGLTPAQLLELIPQKTPFRFVDSILEVNSDKIVGSYVFRDSECFYAGHFPGNPITPGVILLESMGQVGVVALGLYLLSLEAPLDTIGNWTTMLTDAEVEFVKAVYPGDQVTIRGQKMFWRRKKIRSMVEMNRADGTVVARAIISGMGVKNGGLR